MIKKNRREKGNREEDFGSKPHSKGEDFSRSTKVFFERIEASNITITEINKIISLIVKIDKIIYTINNRPYDWKSNILFILYRLIINYPPHQ